jgi:hypothetical protein
MIYYINSDNTANNQITSEDSTREAIEDRQETRQGLIDKN